MGIAMQCDRARMLLDRMTGLDVLVVGDLMLDSYVIGSVERISPEAPVPVVRVTEEREVPGGAANVAVNVNSLGGRSCVAGILGVDRAGDRLSRLLEDLGIDMSACVRTREVPTVEKTRVIAERQQVVRFDRENGGRLSVELVECLAQRAAEAAERADAVVIEDYGKGVVSRPVVEAVVERCFRRRIPVGIDPKDKNTVVAPGLTVATPNLAEACDVAGFPIKRTLAAPEDMAFVETVGRSLLAQWNLTYLIITLGAHGMTLFERDGTPVHLEALAREVFDVTGAGDTVVAATVLALAAGASLVEAASLANAAAGVVVGKLGTATCSPDELIAQLRAEATR